MKTLNNALLAAVIASTFSLGAFAAPPSKSVPMPKPATSSSTGTSSSVQADSSGLTCARMLVPKSGVYKQSRFATVTCTPEMMKNDRRCQQACRNTN